MKTVTTLANLALLICVLALFYDRGMPTNDDVIIVTLMWAAPLASLFFIFTNDTGGNSLPSLYIRRKIAEEKQKLEAITVRKDS